MALFPGQSSDERVLLFVRRHWLIVAQHLLLFGLLGLVPFAARELLNRTAPELLENPQALGTVLLTISAYLYWLFLWLFFLAGWVDYYLDYWVITDRRIVSIELQGLFSRTVAELHLSRVQDATSEVHGFRETMLHFGNVSIQTAGTESRFVFEQIPRPDKVVALIMDLHEKVAGHQPDNVAGQTAPKPAASDFDHS